MKRILTFLLLVTALVMVASYTAPRPSIESIELPPGPPTEAEIAELLAMAPTTWLVPEPVSTEAYTVTVWPTSTEVHALTMWPDLELVRTEVHGFTKAGHP